MKKYDLIIKNAQIHTMDDDRKVFAKDLMEKLIRKQKTKLKLMKIKKINLNQKVLKAIQQKNL